MSMTFTLATSDFNGATATLYNGGTPFLIPVALGPISNGSITFNTAAFNDFALQIDDGTTVLRTGVQDLSLGTVDGNGDFSISYLVMHITDPSDTVIPVATLTAGLSMPMNEGDLTINSLSLSTVGGNVRATGAADYDAGFFGTIPVTYSYDFDLDPVTSATSSRLINVDTVNTSVVGAAGGLLGWIVNAIVGLITFLFNGRISDALEDAVQNEVDAAVDNAFSGAGAPAGSMATLQSVTASAGSVTIVPFVLVPLSAIGCPFNLSSGSIKLRNRAQLRKLHAMRDRLKEAPQGSAYIQILKQHSAELVRLLAQNPALLKQADGLIERGLAEFDEKSPENGILSQDSAKAAVDLMRALANEEGSSRELKQTIELTIPEVRTFVGRPVAEVLKESSDAVRKLSRKE